MSDRSVHPSSDPASKARSTGKEVAGTHAPTDSELISRCRSGDQRAWSMLIERYERLVYSVPRRLGVSAEIADETFQEVWAVLLRRLGTLQHEQALPQWLITTARRIALRAAHRARSRTMHSLEAIEVAGAHDESSEAAFVERVERAQQVADALDRLDAPCRDLLVALTRGELSSYAEIARQTGMPIGSIGPKRARCLARLVRLLPASLRAEFDMTADGEEGDRRR
jgi:RNA polymerase sigma factor (sigma-70 family)